MRPRQTLLLGLLLLVPVLAFLFLFRFGSNRYALPTYLPDRVDSTQVGGEWRRDTVFHQIAPFRLASSSGRTISSQELGQGLYIAQFYDATDAASAGVSRALLRLQEKFRHEPRVRLVTFVLNPAGGPGGEVAHLAEQYGTIAGKWFFLSGSADSLRRLVQQEYRLTAAPKRLPGTGPATNFPAGRLLLIDRQRRVRGIYDGPDGREIDRLLTEITVQLYDYEHPH